MNNIKDKRYHQQEGILTNKKLQVPFTVIGVGAIGSFLTMMLTKMGAENVLVYDFDKIEDHNFSNQMYPLHSIEDLKVTALAEVVAEFSGVKLRVNPVKYEGQSVTPFMISCVDTMEARKLIWEKLKNNGECQHYIDGRMGAQTMLIYSIDPNNEKDIAFYEQTLYSSEDAVQELCTEKSIIYTVLTVAGKMLNQVQKALNKKVSPIEVVYDHVTEITVATYRDAEEKPDQTHEAPAAETEQTKEAKKTADPVVPAETVAF